MNTAIYKQVFLKQCTSKTNSPLIIEKQQQQGLFKSVGSAVMNKQQREPAAHWVTCLSARTSRKIKPSGVKSKKTSQSLKGDVVV